MPVARITRFSTIILGLTRALDTESFWTDFLISLSPLKGIYTDEGEEVAFEHGPIRVCSPV